MDDGSQRPGRSALIDAAERLIAEQGPAVSLRQVVTEAGQRNSAAIRYHFGTRDELIAAVIEARQKIFEPRRLERLAALEATATATARELLEALLGPVFEYQRAKPNSYHARFMEKVRDYPGVELVGRPDWAATTLIVGRITAIAPESGVDRAIRIRGLITVVFALLADLERQDHQSPEVRIAAEQATLDMILGVVSTFSAPP
ncbi:TetR/AcrR family transcriptional regulator [Mycolicibacterium aichiense]|uniref:TetR family transcriptional regulator n=1 Tax=Mycolicibacterium aichiense TaxID=1799 RepID=A0AAD1HMJ1_9MYCO|nr:TetR/AcrR family transcriptional regulator [Mycolicibacterium aichiense]MCV7020129.1 TetR/AcrR family transcriptional regulator [Mycolicibacterium aichiense]BBX07724.1 TetR family transcriptional regulator [Mycolicibacterium aichiense]STZ81537.1 transcriptional regulator [Mycolicibacterium aichiense]